MLTLPSRLGCAQVSVYVVWVMLMAVDANSTLMGEHNGVLINRRKRLALDLTDEPDPAVRQIMRDQDLHLQSAISQLQSVDESMKLFGLKIDKAFVTKIIMTLVAAVVSTLRCLSYVASLFCLPGCGAARCCCCLMSWVL